MKKTSQFLNNILFLNDNQKHKSVARISNPESSSYSKEKHLMKVSQW